MRQKQGGIKKVWTAKFYAGLKANPARGIDVTCFPLFSCVFPLLVLQ